MLLHMDSVGSKAITAAVASSFLVSAACMG